MKSIAEIKKEIQECKDYIKENERRYSDFVEFQKSMHQARIHTLEWVLDGHSVP